jgi:hypothetical protein
MSNRSSNRFYHGDTHTFTASSKNKTIELKAGSGERLYVNGDIRLPQTFTSADYLVNSDFTKYVAPQAPFTSAIGQGSLLWLTEGQLDPNSPYLLSFSEGDRNALQGVGTTLSEYPFPAQLWKKQTTGTSTFLQLSAVINTDDLQGGTTLGCSPQLLPTGSLWNNTVVINWNEDGEPWEDPNTHLYYHSTLIYKQTANNTYTLNQRLTDYANRRSIVNQNYLIAFGYSGNGTGGFVLYRDSESSLFNTTPIASFGFVVQDAAFASSNSIAVIDNAGHCYMYNLTPTGITQGRFIRSGVSQVEVCEQLGIVVTATSSQVVGNLISDGSQYFYTTLLPLPHVILDISTSGSGKLGILISDGTLSVTQVRDTEVYDILETVVSNTSQMIAVNDECCCYGDPSVDGNYGAIYANFYTRSKTATVYTSSSMISNDIEGITISTPRLLLDSTKYAIDVNDAALVVKGSIATNDILASTIRGNFLSVPSIDTVNQMTIGSLYIFGSTTTPNLLVNSSITTANLLATKGTFTTATTSGLRVTNSPYGFITGNGLQSISFASPNTLTNSYWNGTAVTQGSMSYSNGAFTVPISGFYMISVTVSFSANTTGYRQMNLIKNGVGPPSIGVPGQQIQACPSGRTAIATSCVINLAANDSIAVQVGQGSGGSLSMDNGWFGNFTIYNIG